MAWEMIRLIPALVLQATKGAIIGFIAGLVFISILEWLKE